jgi:hypothetical protein
MLDLSFSGYYSRGKDFIYSVDTGQTRFLWGRNRAVYLMDNITNESIIDKFNERPELEGNRLEYVPKHSFSAGVDIFSSIVNARVVLNHIGNQYSDDMNTEEIKGYETVAQPGFSASRPFRKPCGPEPV